MKGHLSETGIKKFLRVKLVENHCSRQKNTGLLMSGDVVGERGKDGIIRQPTTLFLQLSCCCYNTATKC